MKPSSNVSLALTALLLTPYAHAETVNYFVIADQARPFQIENKGTDHSGIVTDIIQAVFEDSPYELNTHTYPFKRMISLLESGNDKNWVTYGSPGWGKVQAENLSELPIYTVKHALVSSQASANQYKTMKDLEGKIIVLMNGFDYPQLTPYFSSGKVEEMRVKSYQSAFRVLKRNPDDIAFVEMQSRVSYNIDQLNLNPKHYKSSSFSDVIPDYSIYLAFDPNMDPAIQRYINQRLAELTKQGTISTIIDKYI